MFLLARRNLFHDKVRLSVTLTGILFAVVLMAVQSGLFIGFSEATSGLIENSGADLWVMSEGVPYIEQAVPISERKLYQVRAAPGVARAEKFVARFAQWKKPDGGQEGVFVVGFNPDGDLGAPWKLVTGDALAVKGADNVIMDRLYCAKLGVSRLGETVEINGRRARVVGFTNGIRSFTTMPYVFTSFKNAQDYTALREDKTDYILVRAKAGVEVPALQRSLAVRLRDVEVHTTAEFSRMTWAYWLFTTGAGIAVLIAAALGLLVGIVVVTQTIYATTMDHLREFGTLKAMGASNGYIYRIIIQQALMSALIGYVFGMIVTLFVVHGSRNSGAAILMPWQMAASMFVITLAMCVGAAMVSINRVTRLDPAMVFKG